MCMLHSSTDAVDSKNLAIVMIIPYLGQYVRTYVKSRLAISLVTQESRLGMPLVTLKFPGVTWNSTHAHYRVGTSACPCIERSRKSDRTYIYPLG